MRASIKTVNSLVLECTNDIHWEFNHIRYRICPDEIHRVAEGLLHRTSLAWPLALIDLQKGNTLNRLLTHLNFHVRQYGFFPEIQLTFTGPFPTLSLKPLLAIANEHRTTLRTARCIEFLGNKAWDLALKPVKKGLPIPVKAATLALTTLGCSSNHQSDAALFDLSRRIEGQIINFLCDWEMSLTQQIKAQLLTPRADKYRLVTETAV